MADMKHGTTSMVDELIIDVDAHLTEPADVWTSRMPARYLDRVPHVVRDDAGIDVWMLEGERLGTVGGSAPAGAQVGPTESPKTYDDVHPAAFDAHARLRHLDELGFWAQVLYPNVAGFGAQRFLRLGDPELMLLCVRAYNDFLADWCSADSRRLLGVCATPFWDPLAAADEIRRAADLGHRGVLMTGEPQALGFPNIGDRSWDPMWNAADECGLAIHFHLGSGDMSKAFTPERVAAHGLAETYAFTAVELFLKNATQVSDLLLSGVLERHPNLKFVSVESGIGWVPFVLEAADYSFAEARYGSVSEVRTKPSELFERQVYACYWFEQFAPRRLLDTIPVSNVLFETDFPHPICLHGDVRATIDASLSEASPTQRRKILWENAAELYRVEAPVAHG
jgi:predicted TIM-barrel fold metal-dependent hydrolase